MTDQTAGSGSRVSAAPTLKSNPAQRLAPPPARPQHGRYAAAWSVAGLVAAGYAASVIIVPDIRTQFGADVASTATSATIDRTVADVAQLKRQMSALEGQVAVVKQQATQQDVREKVLAERVGNVETRLEGFATQMAQISPEAGRKGNTAVAAALPTASAPPPVAPSRVVNAPAEPRPQAARIETGSITPPPANAQRDAARAPAVAGWGAVATPATPGGAGAVQPAPTVISADSPGVQLATGQSIDALRLSWTLLNERHANVLRQMEPRVVEAGPGRYTLVAGPVASDADANRVCTTLRARGVACQPTEFRGSGL